MEKMKENSLMDQRALMIKELVQGIELVKQLRVQMSVSSTDNCPASSREDDRALNHLLVDKMLSAFDRSISLAKLFKFDNEVHHDHSDSQHSPAHRCPRSEDNSSQDPRLSKKRKKMSPKIQWVRVNPGESGSGLGGPLNDGFSWRKYGQKEILKAKYPRGYYRCTHRHTQGCGATKQVQKSDQDPCIYQVIYKGEHTCTQTVHLAQTREKPNPTQSKPESHSQSQLLPTPQQQYQIVEPNQQELTLGFDQGDGPKVEQVEKEDEAQIFGPILFNSAQCEPEGLFENCMLSSSPEFWLTASSESNYFSASPCRIMAFGPGLNVQVSELNEPMSGPSSASNSPYGGGFELPFDMFSDKDATFSLEFDSLLCPM